MIPLCRCLYLLGYFPFFFFFLLCLCDRCQTTSVRSMSVLQSPRRVHTALLHWQLLVPSLMCFLCLCVVCLSVMFMMQCGECVCGTCVYHPAFITSRPTASSQSVSLMSVCLFYDGGNQRETKLLSPWILLITLMCFKGFILLKINWI